ncbi:hypothetical protein [Rhodopseudomonas palustris]|nr:hypothetical protein [Rhodopseudomonas palustris]
MVAALGVVTLTGFALMGHHRRSKSTIVSAHVATGLALIGASYWHYTLYGRPIPRAIVAARPRREKQIK